jgi:glycogen debranching enzyme
MRKGCMGIKTLDPADLNYNGDYINSDASHGWNYHQGPEWLWPVGFFLKALLIFGGFKTKQEAKIKIMEWLMPHREYILSHGNKYEGLPELTNSNGKYCPDSCVTQAWSVSTILDALRDLYYFNDD